MKVLMINGSPHREGCTYTALCEVAGALRGEGVDAEIFHIGSRPVSGCIDCGNCRESHRCALDGGVNGALEMMAAADGLVVGTPVYFGSANGALTAFLDRMFFASRETFWFKPAAAVCTARRAGATATLDVLHKYFLPSRMPIVPSNYWCMVHGNTPDEVRQDLEGMQTMRVLGRNMAWMLKCLEIARRNGVEPPRMTEARIRTNFIR